MHTLLIKVMPKESRDGIVMPEIDQEVVVVARVTHILALLVPRPLRTKPFWTCPNTSSLGENRLQLQFLRYLLGTQLLPGGRGPKRPSTYRSPWSLKCVPAPRIQEGLWCQSHGNVSQNIQSKRIWTWTNSIYTALIYWIILVLMIYNE